MSAVSKVPKVESPKPTFVQNRDGELDFQLELQPHKVLFVCPEDRKPVYCDVQLRNTTRESQSFKVKCTSAEIFRVQPPLGFVRAGETQSIRIWFQNKTSPANDRLHYFAFYHVKSDVKIGKEKEVWTKTTRPDGVRRLLAVFQEKK